MSTRAVEQVDDWDTRSFSGGYRGLHDLADEGFSGIVTVGPTRLCMTKGTVVGVLDGAIEDFEDASGTAHVAPSPALPLLAVMQEGNSEVQAQYYTEETPIREVNGTLSDGNFTGYIELSENVLSGDYYVVYHQGRSMSVAYVGNTKQFLSEDEAFQRANDEVGIYEVVDAGVDVTEIPEPAGAAGGDTGTADAATGAAAAAETADADATEAAETTAATDDSATADADTAADSDADPAGASATDTDPEPEGATATESADGEADRTAQADTGSTPDRREEGGSRDERQGAGDRGESRTETRSEGRDTAAETRSRTDERDQRDRAEGGSRSRSGEADSRGDDATRSRGRDQSRGGAGSRTESGGTGGARREDAGRSSESTGGAAAGGSRRGGRGTTGGSADAGSVGDLETRSIPSLDPSRTAEPESEEANAPGGGVASPQPEPEPRGGTPGREPSRDPNQGAAPAAGDARDPADDRAGEPADTGGHPGAGTGGEPGEIERLEAELDDREAEIDELEAELDARDERIEDLEGELEELRSERDDLQDRLERMESRIDDLRTGEGGESIADRRRMGPGEAIEGTNLFIRYGSKGEATLENAHGGSATREEVNANLDIQYHTQFEAGDVAVDGDPFDEYLEGTIQYRFVEWVVRVLPYEIRDTGHEGALKDLYDAMPRIDRAELNGTISVVYQEDGEEQRTQERFDVVLRDRMGNPLAVANMNESRDPASQGMMEGLITAARRVSESKESLAGAFLVTSSFFEPEAMEAASQATGGGLLSRDKRESFVKLSRKEGFHLCLVEAREAQFNLSVPEI
ncbi:DUF7527 domain-containing protein [Halorientalis marina]|uniref:DUF7527 domain-containing protein n=1 Tax=Halorientalis marina TaxID=2931976 RepID=UPI001FF219A8|nr:hypothetical protein [Halorientalis marina]